MLGTNLLEKEDLYMIVLESEANFSLIILHPYVLLIIRFYQHYENLIPPIHLCMQTNSCKLMHFKFLLQSDIVYHNLNPIKIDYLYSEKLYIFLMT